MSSLSELKIERTKCENLKSAIDSFVSKVSPIEDKLKSSGEKLASGGLIIDSVPADVVSFGGLSNFVNTRITPEVNKLKSISSKLGSEIMKLNREIKRKEDEIERQKEKDKEARKENKKLKNKYGYY